MSYIEIMKSRAKEAFDALHQGVDELVFTDFPDYSNVGDSAIALGQRAYWKQSGIAVKAAYSAPLLPPSVFRSDVPVALNGGGSLGGLYSGIGEHRYRLAEMLDESQLLIQEPQSVHFVDNAARDQFAGRMAGRKNMRIAVRDHSSFSAVSDYVAPILAPDAVHHLGAIPAPAPTHSHVLLARADKESAQRNVMPDSVDWPEDPFDLRALWWLGWRAQRFPIVAPALRRPVESWFGRAERRFERGVEILARGEVVVTDRLHAMLIGLQMGRNVIAIDNSTGKLSAYAHAWFDGAEAPVTFVTSFREALDMVRSS